MKEVLKSKKFVMALIGIIVSLVAHFKPEFSGAVENMLLAIGSYIIGQGVADLGKGAKELELNGK